MSILLDRRLVSASFLLAICVAGCEAPEVVPRESTLVSAGAPGGAATGPRAELLRQVEAVKEKLSGDAKPVGILVALGNLYYENGRYPEAIDWYRQAIEKAAPARATFRTLSGARPDAREGKTLDDLPEGCKARADAKSFAQAIEIARTLTEAGERARARGCYRRALALVAGAHARRGSAWAVLEQTERGLAEIEEALALLPDGPEPLFLYGAVVFNSGRGTPEAFSEKARVAWTRFLEIAPDHPRADQVRGVLETLKAQEVLPPGHPGPGAATPE